MAQDQTQLHPLAAEEHCLNATGLASRGLARRQPRWDRPHCTNLCWASPSSGTSQRRDDGPVGPHPQVLLPRARSCPLGGDAERDVRGIQQPERAHEAARARAAPRALCSAERPGGSPPRRLCSRAAAAASQR
ncbi:unnamed protein product [Prorocentrum cordatum]|uniref:Uncharacterized protein n=1 Tax=Prorocentrum cordatum TaxID=2364126 RepID=A0ABN9WQM3_9DINO|nr:unnamed protein product [Polarella glacialis]